MLMPHRPCGVPDIRTPLPGPRAKTLIDTDEQYTSPSYTRVYPLAVKRGEGAMLEDVDGNKFLDFNAGIAVCTTGHCHPKIVEAIREQAGLLLHMSGTDFYNGPQCDLARKLARTRSVDLARAKDRHQCLPQARFPDKSARQCICLSP